MTMLSVRLPKELDKVLPRKDRSAWVIDAVRQRLRRDRVHAIAESAASHQAEELEALSDWVPAEMPRRRRKSRKTSK